MARGYLKFNNGQDPEKKKDKLIWSAEKYTKANLENMVFPPEQSKKFRKYVILTPQIINIDAY